MYTVTIKQLTKKKGRKSSQDFNFIGELTENVRKQWARIAAHDANGAIYELHPYGKHLDNVINDGDKVTFIDRG